MYIQLHYEGVDTSLYDSLSLRISKIGETITSLSGKGLQADSINFKIPPLVTLSIAEKIDFILMIMLFISVAALILSLKDRGSLINLLLSINTI